MPRHVEVGARGLVSQLRYNKCTVLLECKESGCGGRSEREGRHCVAECPICSMAIQIPLRLRDLHMELVAECGFIREQTTNL